MEGSEARRGRRSPGVRLLLVAGVACGAVGGSLGGDHLGEEATLQGWWRSPFLRTREVLLHRKDKSMWLYEDGFHALTEVDVSTWYFEATPPFSNITATLLLKGAWHVGPLMRDKSSFADLRIQRSSESTMRYQIRFADDTDWGTAIEASNQVPPASLPGGYKVGDVVYYVAFTQSYQASGYEVRVVYGMAGTVVGPTSIPDDVAVQFPQNMVSTGIPLSMMSRQVPPKLAGGYTVGDVVYYIDAGKTFRDDDRLVYGAKGTVVGPGARRETHVAVEFPGNKEAVECAPVKLRKEAPPATLAGGYAVGDVVYFAAAGQTASNGDRVVYRAQGTVVGPGRGAWRETDVAVKFADNTGVVTCGPAQLSREAPPEILANGYTINQIVFWASTNHTFPYGVHVVYGMEPSWAPPTVIMAWTSGSLTILMRVPASSNGSF